MSRPTWLPDSLGARLAAGTRSLFTARGYTEVETPFAVRAPGEEVHLCAFRTERDYRDGARAALWLHTSPESFLTHWPAAQAALARRDPGTSSCWMSRSRGWRR
jgi:lysyl-tRNA synthetase class 2